MPVQLSFFGAAETVTGSKYLLDVDGRKVLIDCGLFQGLKELRLRNWQPPGFDPHQLDAVVLTHAHLDHTGYLPKLVKDGFEHWIYCTPATAELTELILLDSAFNQERDAEYANQKKYSKHDPALPLYEEKDALEALKHLRTVERKRWFSPVEPIWMRYLDAGHLLGSCTIEVEIRNQLPPLRLVFSGDVGRYDAPLYHDPTPPPACDYLICESTYGDRDHPPGAILDELCKVVLEAIARGGVMVVASFAIGRAQQLMYLLQTLIHDGRLPAIPVYLDSPMAVKATHVYQQYRDQHDLIEGDLTSGQSVLNSADIHLASTTDESKQLNKVNGPAVIISSAGMMTGGRILHHLRQRLPDARNTILLGGFMAAGTRGRQLQDGVKYLRIHGQDVRVQAAVVSVSALSGHADRTELQRWLEPLPEPRQVFLTHGEKSSALAFAEVLREKRGWEVVVPKHGEHVVLE